MKIYNGSIMPVDYCNEEKQEIIELINASNANSDAKLSFLNIKDEAGWTYLITQINESIFSINYSSCMFDASYLIKFFTEIIDLKEDLVLFLDYEGSFPIFYAGLADKDNVRFIFAHDYELFMNDDIDDYNISDYKIECDIIIHKKILLNEFYNIFYQFTINYDLKNAYEPVFNIKQGKKYLEKIKKYINL